jgi:fatty acid desaturase
MVKTPEINLGAAAERSFLNPARRTRIRYDFICSTMLFLVGAWRWAAHWPVLVASLAARWTVLSLLENAPHYGTPLDSRTRARNTMLPRWAEWLLLAQNFHGVHHGAPQLKWYELPHAFARSGLDYDGRWTAIVVRQLRGPVRLASMG